MPAPKKLLLATSLLLGAHPAPNSAPLATVSYRSDGTAKKLISLPVSVYGAPARWFILDTGAPRSALDNRLARDLKLQPVKTTREGGTGHGTVPAGHLRPLRLTIGKVSLPVADPLMLDMANVPIGPDNRGLIGSELLSAYVVQIDPTHHTVSIFDPSTFQPRRGDVRLPLGVDGERRRFYLDAVLQVRPGLTVTHRLRIDTGSEDSVDDPIVKQARRVTATQLGNGLGSNFQGVSGVYDRVTIGPFPFTYVWGPGGDLPAIGMELLRRFTVTFDAPHHALYLRPNAALSEPVPPPS